MANRTAAEILTTLFVQGTDPYKDIPEAQRQLCEAIEKEVIGFGELIEPGRPGHNIDVAARNGLRNAQRARLRTFFNMPEGEQLSADTAKEGRQ